jgi:hypothetical protein
MFNGSIHERKLTEAGRHHAPRPCIEQPKAHSSSSRDRPTKKSKQQGKKTSKENIIIKLELLKISDFTTHQISNQVGYSIEKLTHSYSVK